MKLILDTHTLIWWWNGDNRLSAPAIQAISDESNQVLVSAASVWEMSTKHRRGKLPEVADALRRFDMLMSADGFSHLAVQWHHSLLAGQYPHHHPDPFDRVLAAQTQLEKAVLVTRDEALKTFGIKTFW